MLQVSSGGVVIYKNKIMMLKKTDGEYCLPKGHVEKGETLEEAALRETKEESNIDGEIISYLGKIQYSFVNYKRNKIINKEVHWYLMSAKSFEPKPLSSEGFVAAKFVFFKKALSLIHHDDEKKIIKDALNKYWSLK